MEIYRVEKQKGRFFEYFFIVVVSVFGTLVIENAFIKANEMEQRISKLSYMEPKEKMVQNDLEKEVSLNIDSILNTTVGIGFDKPNGIDILDVDVEEKWGIGTGVIVSEKGYIVTNQHLAKRVGASVIVTLNSGKSVPGKIVWNEENLDLAILKINEKSIASASIINDDGLRLRRGSVRHW